MDRPTGDGGAAAVTTTTTTAMDMQETEVRAAPPAPERAEDAAVRDGAEAEAVTAPKCPNLCGILRVAENRRVLIGLIPTLTLAIMGG